MRLLPLLLLPLLGCGAGGPCAQRSGTIRQNLTARSGNCGAVAESVATSPTQPTSLPAGCTGSLDVSADNCEVTMDATCPNGSGGATSKLTGKVTWNEAGTSGSGIVDLTARDGSGAVTCQGTYNAVYTKI
jgi:hypothetical protein